MRAKRLGAVSAAALLCSVSVANAQGPMQLTDTQLDTVTAGVATAAVLAAAQGGTVTGAFALAASNTSATVGSASASISASLTPTGIAPHTLSLAAFASAP